MLIGLDAHRLQVRQCHSRRRSARSITAVVVAVAVAAVVLAIAFGVVAMDESQAASVTTDVGRADFDSSAARARVAAVMRYHEASKHSFEKMAPQKPGYVM